MKKEILLLTSLLAFCSIAYELLFANTLAMLAGGTIWWHSLTIGVYIAGLGIGTFRAGKSLFPARDLVRIELYLSFVGMSSVFAVYAASAFYETGSALAQVGYVYDLGAYIRLHTSLKILFFLVTQSLVLLVGILSGFEVPLLIRLSGEDGRINRLLAANYIGTLVGTLAFAYFLLPKLDVIYTAVFVGGVNLLVCVWLVWRYLPKFSMKLRLGITFCFTWLVLLSVFGQSYQSVFLQIYYRVSYVLTESDRSGLVDLWKRVTRDGPVTRQKSLYQYIDYFDVSWREHKEFILSLDTNFQFSSRTERSYHEAFAHVPMLVMGEVPKKILVLGAGDGMLVRELLKYPQIEFIRQVELDEEIVNISRTHPVISKLNENSFDDPRLDLIIDDAFQYLRRSKETYDAVFIDFPYPKNYNLAKLFSVEFYSFVRRVLSPTGFMVIDAPIRNKGAVAGRSARGVQIERAFLPQNEKTNSTIISTVHAAGFKTFFPYLIKNESFLLSTNTTKALNFDLSQSEPAQIENIDQDSLNQVGQQYFPYEIDKRFVNSVFHPVLID